MNFTIYCDGGCWPNPGKGSASFVVLNESRSPVFENVHRESYTTNNRMEIMGAVNSIRWCLENSAASILVFSDSQYVVQGASSWVWSWVAKGWKKNTVKNRDLWEALHSLLKIAKANNVSVKFRWVKGHNGDQWNEYVDRLGETG